MSNYWLLILADSLLIFHTILVAFVILGKTPVSSIANNPVIPAFPLFPASLPQNSQAQR